MIPTRDGVWGHYPQNLIKFNGSSLSPSSSPPSCSDPGLVVDVSHDVFHSAYFSQTLSP